MTAPTARVSTHPTAVDTPTPLLQCRNLHVSFHQEGGVGRAVRGVDFTVQQRQTLGVVGESGCGKSVTALSIMRLIQCPPGRIEQGSILFNGQDLLLLDDQAIRKVRGRQIAMVFQDPMTSLNPVYTCGWQIAEALRLHLGFGEEQARTHTHDLLQRVGIHNPRQCAESYPHQLSGGMRQRVMIAMALSCEPRLLIADEPTTALDVTVQARIMDLLYDLQQQMHMSMILISHDLGLVCDIAHAVVVMYAGLVVEYAPVTELFKEPLHPYAQALFTTIPRVDVRRERLHVIAGEVPNPMQIPGGCPFHPRCEKRRPECEKVLSPLKDVSPGHQVRCVLYD